MLGVAFVGFLIAFFVTGGYDKLFGEVVKMTPKEANFNRFTTHFKKTYSNETEKEKRMEIYLDNQREMIRLNEEMLDIKLDKDVEALYDYSKHNVGRVLADGRVLSDRLVNAITGETYANRQEAYEVGCKGRAYCFLRLNNQYSDKETEEFFAPRRNTGKLQFEYYVELQGEPPAEVDWMQYVSNKKNQGETNTCYLQVFGTVNEIIMTKTLRKLPKSY